MPILLNSMFHDRIVFLERQVIIRFVFGVGKKKLARYFFRACTVQ